MQPASPPLTSLTKAHGGKHYLKGWIIGHMVPGRIFVEPFAFGASVLLNTPRSPGEFMGDLNPEVINFWEVVRDRPDELFHRLSRVRYNEETFLKAKEGRWGKPNDPLDGAVRFLVCNRMSRGGLGKSFAWSERTRGGRPGDLNAWKNAVGRIPWVSKRLQGVHIVCTDAADMISQLDGEETVFYLDPPYLKETRKAKKAYGPYEMTREQHEALLDLVLSLRGAVYLSGYASELYDSKLAGWARDQRQIANHSGQNSKKQKRTEVLWSNRPFPPKPERKRKAKAVDSAG